MWPSHAGANPARPAASSNTDEPSATRSYGEPAPKDESTTSNAATAGTALNYPGIQGARTWCGHGVFAHNLVKIGALAA